MPKRRNILMAVHLFLQTVTRKPVNHCEPPNTSTTCHRTQCKKSLMELCQAPTIMRTTRHQTCRLHLTRILLGRQSKDACTCQEPLCQQKDMRAAQDQSKGALHFRYLSRDGKSKSHSKDYSPASEPAIDWPDSDLPPSDPPAESGDDTPLAEPRTPILARLPRNCTPTKNAPLYMKKALERRKDLDNISIVPAPQVVQEPMNILTVSITPYIMLQVSDKARRIHLPIQHETQKNKRL